MPIAFSRSRATSSSASVDPAVIKKKELTELGEKIINDIGKATKSMIKHSNVHDNMMIISKSFAAHEGNIAQTEELIKQMSALSKELSNQVGLLQSSLDSMEPLNNNIVNTSQSIHRIAPCSKPHF
ncbi:hypothetical protein DICPUDRAFT_34686 [Dictyostelium purpureum]|uniref:BLOC-1-related complex subunit 7 n=1 Tax=Dictyostelium purpureum TaxID=5786 RepID=F0ZN49_DICPU|nr:uncharacterized protein DICPUDRAFT_34686 [Dictyostelium purpureum]EGC34616.1 hypothetical protein DICPUDRAFT_34686 [Dictyostelium purpureum]|eukprot:XP_003288841.1 hypothetical protein DICPUDRAFT_34686 [Dictyostelium purpureum]